MTLAVTRVLMGFVFLWAFFDKLLGLGYSTKLEHALINGGSPTTGYLSSLDGTFSAFFNSLAGNPFVDMLFMLGLLGVGVGLTFGIAMRISVIAGSLMLFLMWLAALPISTNPFVDDHVMYICVLVILGFAYPLQRLSLGGTWRSLDFVKNNRWLE